MSAMTPLLVDLSCAVPPAIVAYAVTKRFPRIDPLAPQVSTPAIATSASRHPRLARMLSTRLDPTTETGLLLTVAVVGVVGALSGIGVLARMISSHRGLAAYDLSFAKWGARHANSSSTSGLVFVSRFGGYQVTVLVAVLVAIVEHRRRLGRSVVPFLVLVVGGQYAIVSTIKAIVGRERPNIVRLTGFAGASFPSGHAAAAAATYAAVSLLVGRRRSPSVKAAIASGAAALTFAVAGSRVMLGVHWFTDVLAGVAIGWIWFTLVSIAFGGRILRFGTPVIVAEAAVSGIEPPQTRPAEARRSADGRSELDGTARHTQGRSAERG